MRYRLEGLSIEIELQTEPFGKGGEGNIYALASDDRLAAKIYHKATPVPGDKLAAMIARPPADPMARTGLVSIAWPTHRLLTPDEAPRVAGFLMPRVQGARPIHEIYNPRSRLELSPGFHFGYLMRTARNLANAVSALHASGYVVGDLNESNVLVNNRAVVTLVDTDSFQVPAGERVFRCQVGRPDYTPPELRGTRFGEVDRRQEHDAFGLAVLIFQLLMQGIHPFQGKFIGQGDAGEIRQRIAAGHWPYARSRQVPFEPNPHAPPLVVLPPAVRELFQRCFDEGHTQPARRPTAAEWGAALKEGEALLQICPANRHHLSPCGLTACPWCLLAQARGRDLFPPPPEDEVIVVLEEEPLTVLPADDPGDADEDLLPTVLPVDEKYAARVLLDAGESPEEALARRQRAVDELKHNQTAPAVAVRPGPPRRRPHGNGGLLAVAVCAVLLVVAGVYWVLTIVLASPQPVAATNRVVEEPEKKPDKPPPPPPPPPRLDIARRFADGAGRVTCVAYSPVQGPPFTGTALTGNEDGALVVWNVETCQRVHHIEAHPAPNRVIRSVAFSPVDGKRALSAGDDGVVRVWDVTTGKQISTFTGHSPWSVMSAAFSPNGLRAISGGDDKVIRLWDVDTGKEVRSFEGHTGSVTSVAFVPPDRILSGSADRSLRLWNADTGKLVRVLEGHKRAVTSVAVSADGNHALSGGRDNNVYLWDLRGGGTAPRLSLSGHHEEVQCVAFSPDPDGTFALSGGNDKQVIVWRVEDGKAVQRFTKHTLYVRGVAFSPDGKAALSGGAGSVWVWPVDTEP
jgi:hypothetical protein